MSNLLSRSLLRDGCLGLVCLTVGTAVAFSADTPASTSSTPQAQPPEPARYEYDSSRESYNSSSYYERNNNYFPSDSSFRSVMRRMMSFPPVPPVLGDPLPEKNTLGTGVSFSRRDLMTDGYEFFYPSLSALSDDEVGERLTEQLNEYRTARGNLLAALQARLDALQTADPDTRRRQLAQLAKDQAAGLAALDTAAETLRVKLARIISAWDNSDYRNGRMSGAQEESFLCSRAAFFQDGLSLDQRRLLRERVVELSGVTTRAPDAELALNSPGPFIFFGPETARVRLPSNLAPELRAKVQAYVNAKTELKTELTETLLKTERALFNFKRVAALRELAEKQAPQFAAVEGMAEEIRLALAPVPMWLSPAAPTLPPELAARIKNYYAQKAAWQKAMADRRQALKVKFPDERVDYSRQAGELVVQIAPRPRQPQAVKAELPALAAFNAEQARRYEELVQEKAAISSEVVKGAATGLAALGEQSIDQLLKLATFSLTEQERLARYRTYALAAFQPGLSPEQRRLLFGAALEGLELAPSARYPISY